MRHGVPRAPSFINDATNLIPTLTLTELVYLLFGHTV